MGGMDTTVLLSARLEKYRCEGESIEEVIVKLLDAADLIIEHGKIGTLHNLDIAKKRLSRWR